MPSDPEPLATLGPALRDGERDLLEEIDHLEARCREREPEIHALVGEEGRFERLRRDAERLLEEYPDPDRRPPLFGVVTGLKDIFHADGFPTSAGSDLPPEELAGPEAASVARLKAAGALLLGKTVSTQFAFFAPGPTRNPRNPEHTPGGSSSGSAAAVAAGLCHLALGTQTYGSVSRPAAYCGVTGFKPTYDRISRRGVIPLSPSLDHVGVFTVGVAGGALAASVLCREWRPGRPGRQPLLGVPEGPYLGRASAAAREHFDGVRQRLEAAGYRCRAVAAFEDLEAIEARHTRIVAAEAAQVHAEWFGRYRDRYHRALRELIEDGARVGEAELAAARAGRAALRERLTRLMKDHDVDLWIAPAATGPAPRGLDSTGDPAMSTPWTHAGLPTLALPAGADPHGLPLGLQVIGRWHGDEELLAQGERLEATLGRDGA